MNSCIVIGAGLSGLIVAQQIQAAGLSVTVLDKGRGVGGRMATRRIGGGVVDHGAQFFTVRDDRFRQLVTQWQSDGVVVEWTRGFADAEGNWNQDGYPRYRGSTGMTALPQYLAQGLTICTSNRVTSVEQRANQWQIMTEAGDMLHADALVMTAPVPQALDLLAKVTLPADVQSALTSIEYHPCIAVLAVLDSAPAIPRPGGVQIDGEPIRWLADNTQKGISPDEQTITIHGAPQFSRDHWDMDRTAAGEWLLKAATRWLGAAKVKEFQVHGWRYSQPVEVHQDPCLWIAGPPPIVFAGDAFAGPRVEGAVLSGLAAADALLKN